MIEDALQRINKNLEEWSQGLLDPQQSQEELLQSFLKDYVKTEYGQKHNAGQIQTIKEYREKFPVTDYNELVPWFERARNENYDAFLPEKPITWVMTRGTMGQSKIIPVTQTHNDQIVKGGSRGILNYAMTHDGLTLLMGGVLNLQFPSNTATMEIGDDKITYGYSSGTYARLNPMMAGLQLIPLQEEIDALETDLSSEGWEKRYEYIYQQAKETDVVTIMGVAPVQTGFARYVQKRHGTYPRDLWDLNVIFSTSVPKIQNRYGPWLKRLYGDVPVVEMYTATEGAFGQQKDELPYFVPNFDLYFFEVRMGNRYKMLHELKRGEWGSLIVSTPILPRYEIGDLIEAMGKNYFRVFGRDQPLTRIEHVLYRLFIGWMS